MKKTTRPSILKKTAKEHIKLKKGGQFKKFQLYINTEHTQQKMPNVNNNYANEPLVEDILKIFNLNNLNEVGKIINEQYIDYFEKCEKLRMYIKHTCIYEKLKKHCETKEILVNKFDKLVFELLDIHFYDYEACVEWIEFHKNEPIKYILGESIKGFSFPYKLKGSNKRQIIYELCNEFIKCVKIEYKNIYDFAKSWYNLYINGKDSQLNYLTNTVSKQIVKHIKNKYTETHKIEIEIDKLEGEIMDKVDEYSKNFNDYDYAMYSILVNELPENHMLKVIDEAKFDKFFDKTQHGRIKRRKWLVDNIYNLSFKTIQAISDQFNVFVNLINFNLDKVKYDNQIKELKNTDLKIYQNISKMLEICVQTSEFETLIENFNRDTTMYFRLIFR